MKRAEAEPLTESEQNFARGMEQLDLEEVNLLDAPPAKPPDAFGRPAPPRSGKLDGAPRAQPLPSRDTGWKVE